MNGYDALVVCHKLVFNSCRKLDPHFAFPYPPDFVIYNACFGCELLMKAVILSEKGECKHIHELSDLFEEFSDATRESCNDNWNKFGGVRLGSCEDSFDAHLKHVSKHFLIYRYPDQKHLQLRLKQVSNSPQIPLQIGASILNLFYDWQGLVKPAQPYEFFVLS